MINCSILAVSMWNHSLVLLVESSCEDTPRSEWIGNEDRYPDDYEKLENLVLTGSKHVSIAGSSICRIMGAHEVPRQ